MAALEIEGVRFRLVDTAGLRESEDKIEKIGIERAKRLVRSADLLLFLSEEWTKEDDALLSEWEGLPRLIVCTKRDLGRGFPADAIVSSRTGEGVEELKRLLYERGVGETLACGTGACAAVVAGIRRGALDRAVEVEMRGGRLKISWASESESVFLTGPAQSVFKGEMEI